MTQFRNIITMGIVLAVLFGIGGRRVYQSMYKEPRQQLEAKKTQYEKGIESATANIAVMQKVIAANQRLYYRSFPRLPNAVQSHYPLWLTQTAEFCAISNPEVTAAPQQNLPIGIQYRYRLTGRGSIDKLARLLYEFYWTPNLHRVLSIQLVPMEQSDDLDIDVQFEGLALRPAVATNPYPSRDQFPAGYFRRLSSGPFRTYSAIGSRNLLQYARSGIDKADYTFLVAVMWIDQKPEIHLKDRTTDYTTVAKLGDRVEIGSFVGTIRAITNEDDVLFQHPDGKLWLLSVGDKLSGVYPLPPELGSF